MIDFFKTFTHIYFKHYRPSIKDILLAQCLSIFWSGLLLLLSEFYTLVFFLAILFTSFVSLLDQQLFISKNELLMFSLEKTKLYFPFYCWQRVLLADVLLNTYIFLWILGACLWLGQPIYIGFTLLIYFGFKIIEFFYFVQKDKLDNNLITLKIVVHVLFASILFIVYTIFRPNFFIRIFNTDLLGFIIFFSLYGLLSIVILILLRQQGTSENKLFRNFLVFLRNWDIHYYKEVRTFLPLYLRNLFGLATLIWIWIIGDDSLASRFGILIIYSFILTVRTFSVKEKRQYLNIKRDHFLKDHLIYKRDVVQWLIKKKRFSILLGTSVKVLAMLIVSFLIDAFYFNLFLLYLLLSILFTQIEFRMMLIHDRIEHFQSLFIKFLTAITFMLILYLEFYVFFGVFLLSIVLVEKFQYKNYLKKCSAIYTK